VTDGDEALEVVLLLLLSRRHMARIHSSVVRWQLLMFEVYKEMMLAMSVLMLAANILLFTLALKTFLHLD